MNQCNEILPDKLQMLDLKVGNRICKNVTVFTVLPDSKECLVNQQESDLNKKINHIRIKMANRVFPANDGVGFHLNQVFGVSKFVEAARTQNLDLKEDQDDGKLDVSLVDMLINSRNRVPLVKTVKLLLRLFRACIPAIVICTVYLLVGGAILQDQAERVLDAMEEEIVVVRETQTDATGGASPVYQHEFLIDSAGEALKLSSEEKTEFAAAAGGAVNGVYKEKRDKIYHWTTAAFRREILEKQGVNVTAADFLADRTEGLALTGLKNIPGRKYTRIKGPLLGGEVYGNRRDIAEELGTKFKSISMPLLLTGFYHWGG